MPICNTDNFISQLQAEINGIVGDSCPWCQVSGGANLTVALKSDGTIWTWGYNNQGRLGNGTTSSRSSPGTISGGGTTWCQISSGYAHVSAIKTDGTLWTWGNNSQGRLGDGTTVSRSSPGTIAGGGTNWCQVSSSLFHTAAIKIDGTLWTWGNNSDGQLGNGTTVSRCSPGTTAGCGTDWFRISSSSNGSLHTVAIKTDGTLWTWGCNGQGQLGDGASATTKNSPGTVSGGGTTWCQVSGGASHTTGVKCDGTLWTWGCNGQGRLGDGTAIDRLSPVQVSGGGTTWCQSIGGGNSSIAIKSDGTIWTWGYNNAGRLGTGTTVNRSSPGTVWGSYTTWCEVFASALSSAIKTDGTLWTWGVNCFGQLGDGTIVSRCSPGSVAIAPVASAEDFLLYAEAIAQVTDNRKVSIASSSLLPDPLGNGIPTGQMVFLEDRMIPVIANGHDWDDLNGRALVTGPKYCLFTWGRNSSQLGDGTTVSRSSPGTVAGGGTNWCQISAGAVGRAAIKTDGTLWTWGSNSYISMVIRSSPGTIYNHTSGWCMVSVADVDPSVGAIKTDGTLWTWGDNTAGQLGNAKCNVGAPLGTTSPGTVAGGGTTWCKICFSSGPIALKCDGSLWTWGCNNVGQLGCGTAGAAPGGISPGTVLGGGYTWCEISSAPSSNAAIKTDGTLWTWGGNTCGRLGDGTTANRCSVGTVAGGGTNWCKVSLGNCTGAAIKTDGTLWTWGNNLDGQLGDGTTLARSSPGTVAGGGTTWCHVLASASVMGALKLDGTLWTWGCNRYGALGIGSTINSCSPGTIVGGGNNWFQISNNGFSISGITRQ